MGVSVEWRRAENGGGRSKGSFKVYSVIVCMYIAYPCLYPSTPVVTRCPD